jgi:hypothetical protein
MVFFFFLSCFLVFSGTGGPQHHQVVLDPSAVAANPAAAACLALSVPLVSILGSLGLDRDNEPSSTLVLVNLFRPKELVAEDDFEDALVGFHNWFLFVLFFFDFLFCSG